MLRSDRARQWRAVFAGGLGVHYAVIPAIVLPLAIALHRSPYLWALLGVYVAATVLLDECLPAGSHTDARGKALPGDFWLKLFGVNLIAFCLLAFVAIDPDGPIPSLWGRLVPTEPPGTVSPFQTFGLVVVMGLFFGIGFNVAHDLIHRVADKWRWLYGYLLLVVSMDSQMSVSHVYAHHPNVGLAQDAATARRGESLYRFFLRSTLWQYREAWRFEAERLRGKGRSPLSRHNRVLSGAAGSIVLASAIACGFGVRSLWCYLAACLIGKFLFESAQYIQHYGLVRLPKTRVEARHSWDCAGAATRLFMFNQHNHASHHLKPAARFWELRCHDGAPAMPFGYIAMMAIAAVPPLWFAVMDPLVDRWAQSRASPEEAEFLRRRLAG